MAAASIGTATTTAVAAASRLRDLCQLSQNVLPTACSRPRAVPGAVSPGDASRANNRTQRKPGMT